MSSRGETQKRRSAERMSRLGAHMSIAGGLPRAVERVLEVEGTALQLFVKSSRQWKARPLALEETGTFRNAVEAAGLERHVMAHASYLINLASSNGVLWRRSLEALSVEVDRCAALGIPYLVLHPGSHGGSGERSGLERLARALDHLYRPPGRKVRASRRQVQVLLEITAGQGNGLGSTFEELAWVLEHASCSDSLGICFDTCHALAAGYEFRDGQTYEETFRHFDRAIGLGRLKAFHLNDSRNGLGSHLDRHEHIGHGEVGLEAFRLILNDPRFRNLPMVLETPKGEDLGEDKINLGVLRAMIGR